MEFTKNKVPKIKNKASDSRVDKNGHFLNDNRLQNQTPFQLMAKNEVMQLMKPDKVGWYKMSDGEELFYKGAPPIKGKYKFYSSESSALSKKVTEDNIVNFLRAGESESAPMAVAASSGAGSSSRGLKFGKDKVHHFEQSEQPQSDGLISGDFEPETGEFDQDYQEKIRPGNKYYQRINHLVTEAKRFMTTLPKDQKWVGLWRFHMNATEYESHAFQEAQGKQQMVSRHVLENAIHNLDLITKHMYESSSKHHSPGVSFTRSLDAIIDASFHTGADSVLQKVIFGGDDISAAKFLSFVAIPASQLKIPELSPIPKDAENRDKKGMARARSMKEMEALHLPLPDSGGKTFTPVFTVQNPFAYPIMIPEDIRETNSSSRLAGMIVTQKGMIKDQIQLIQQVEGKSKQKAIPERELLAKMEALLREMVQSAKKSDIRM